MWKKLIMLALSITSLQGVASTGYFLVGGGGGVHKKIAPNFASAFSATQNDPSFQSLTSDYKHHGFQGILGSMYMYSISSAFNLSSLVYLSYDFESMDLNQTVNPRLQTDLSDGITKLESSVALKNKLGVGFDIHAGIPFSKALFYGLLGIKLNFPKVRGSLSAKTLSQKEASQFDVYFGKAAQKINDIEFPKQKQSLNYLWRLNVGGGLQYFFLPRFFVGVEAKYFLPKSKKLRAQYALYDPHGVTGLATGPSPDFPKEKLRIKTKINQWGVFATFGIKL